MTEEERIEFPRYFLRIAYDGTNYHGWQRQPNAHSVQAEIESALCKVLRLAKVVTIGCGRTDTGVHASDFYLHFVPERNDIQTSETLFRIQQVVAKDISIKELIQVNHRAHARFDAFERSYEYRLIQRRDPFLRHHTLFFPHALNFEVMNTAASQLIGRHDFASFCKSGGGQTTTICEVRRAEWVNENDVYVFHITADRFLRNMVRAVVGTLLEVGLGKMSVEEFVDVIHAGRRGAAGDSVKPQGLFLTQIKYPDSTFEINNLLGNGE
ncbi:MAG: tRNA pseudouridine(38-40) synthase TruA [Bacteroidota bacterium]|jgi:tRNA pseudouridine38-40 synthase